MLARIIILNSGTYGKASIRFDDANSIQLVGPNNVGKSTLIYTLNFLYIIAGNKMAFSGNKSEKETIHHYFPNPANSYLIFEIKKQRYYCIIIKRGGDGELEYYRLENEFREDLFLKSENNKHKILNFEEVRENIATNGLDLHSFKNKTEVFNFVYQRGKKTNAAVWLEDLVVSDGLSNNFSKVYRFLIDSKLITNKSLKDTLLIADNRDRESINFTQKDRRDIVSLLRANDEIKIFESIKDEFVGFKEVVRQQRAKEKIVAESTYAFNELYPPVRIEFETNARKKKKEMEDLTIHLNEELIPKQQKNDREIGAFENDIKNKNKLLSEYEDQLKEINSLPSLELLNQTLANLDEKRKNLETQLTRIESSGLTVAQIENKIKGLNTQIDTKTRQIKNFSKQLIHNISKSQGIKEKLNFIFSEEFISNLTKEDVKKEVTKVDSLMTLFDGQISLPDKLNVKPLISLDKLKEELNEVEKELTDYKNLLPVAKDFETKKWELEGVKDSIVDCNKNIQKIASKPSIEKLARECESEISDLVTKKDAAEKKLNILKEDITRKQESIKLLDEQRDDYEKKLNAIRGYKQEIEEIGLVPIENDFKDSLENIYKKIKLFNKDREDLKTSKNYRFDKLKSALKSTQADEDEFIKHVDDEIASLPDKRKSIDGYLQAISVQFANPAAAILKRYNEFREFIYNKFNTKLGKIKVSDIEDLKIELTDNKKILEDLRKISSIQDLTGQFALDFGQSDSLKVLNVFLDSGKEIKFEELFDIELYLTKDGKVRKVDLKEQVESGGTDKMIRLIFVMSVINRLAINSKENKIILFIDEIATIDGNNRRELFKFCEEHNFIPICASPDETILDGFDKYVFLYRPSKGNKVNVSEKNPNVIFQEKLV